MLRRIPLTALAALLLLLPTLPAASPARAQTQWRVVAGAESEDHAIQVTAFLPESITINVGDEVIWSLGTDEYHTVTFTSGGDLPDIYIPDPHSPGDLIINPVAAAPAGGPTYDGTGYVNSGLPGQGFSGGLHFSLIFTRPGTFRYFCLIHEGMSGTVNVLADGTPPLDPGGVLLAGAIQGQLLLNRGRQLMESQTVRTAPGPGGTTVYTIAAGVGDRQVSVIRFLPPELTIQVGDTVVWLVDPKPIHTVTFLAGTPEPEDILETPVPGGAGEIQVNPRVSRPTGGNTYDGRGFFNSGFLGRGLFPDQFQLTFTAAGRFPYIDLIYNEEGMVGVINVQGPGGAPAGPPGPMTPIVPPGSGGGFRPLGDQSGQVSGGAIPGY